MSNKNKLVKPNEGGAVESFEDEAQPATALQAVEDAHQLDAAELVQQGFSTETVVKLMPGQMVRGTFLGKGADVLVDDPNGQMETVDGVQRIKQNLVHTYRILTASRALTAIIFGTNQIDARLGTLEPGRQVIVALKGVTKTRKGRNVNDYVIMVGPPDAKYIAEARQLSSSSTVPPVAPSGPANGTGLTA